MTWLFSLFSNSSKYNSTTLMDVRLKSSSVSSSFLQKFIDPKHECSKLSLEINKGISYFLKAFEDMVQKKYKSNQIVSIGINGFILHSFNERTL